MNRLIEILFKIKRYFVCKRFHRIAKKKYRVVQTDLNRFEIQAKEQISWKNNDCLIEFKLDEHGYRVKSGYHPIIIDNISNYCTDINKFRKVCDKLRYDYFIDLIREYDKETNEKIKSLVYPKVIY